MQDEKTFGFLTDQNQIGANVAITIALPSSGEGMIPLAVRSLKSPGNQLLPRFC